MERLALHFDKWKILYQNKKNDLAKDNRIIREVENEAFRPLELLEKDEDTDFILKADKDSMLRIKFDFDEKKIKKLQKEIKRNGGDKNLLLATQVVLQKNQRSFLMGWSPR